MRRHHTFSSSFHLILCPVASKESQQSQAVHLPTFHLCIVYSTLPPPERGERDGFLYLLLVVEHHLSVLILLLLVENDFYPLLHVVGTRVFHYAAPMPPKCEGFCCCHVALSFRVLMQQEGQKPQKGIKPPFVASALFSLYHHHFVPFCPDRPFEYLTCAYPLSSRDACLWMTFLSPLFQERQPDALTRKEICPLQNEWDESNLADFGEVRQMQRGCAIYIPEMEILMLERSGWKLFW